MIDRHNTPLVRSPDVTVTEVRDELSEPGFDPPATPGWSATRPARTSPRRGPVPARRRAGGAGHRARPSHRPTNQSGSSDIRVSRPVPRRQCVLYRRLAGANRQAHAHCCHPHRARRRAPPASGRDGCARDGENGAQRRVEVRVAPGERRVSGPLQETAEATVADRPGGKHRRHTGRPSAVHQRGSTRAVAPAYSPPANANAAATATVAAFEGAISGRPSDVGTTACWPRRPPAAEYR